MKIVHDIEECKTLTKNNGKIVLRDQVLLYCTTILRYSRLGCFMVSEAKLLQNRKQTSWERFCPNGIGLVMVTND
jgi:hypothetical protein